MKPLNLNDKLIKSLSLYFDGKGCFEGLGLKSLSKNYQWPKKGSFPLLNRISMIKIEGKSNYEKNIGLKENSQNIWRDGVKLDIANWAISDWGGIRGNRPKTIQSYVDAINDGNHPNGISGVASYSKILSFMDPKKYAIYDARVAISLNAIQMLCGEKSGLIFCYLPGRNTALTRFRNLDATKPKELVKIGWEKIPRKDCYLTYIRYMLGIKSLYQNVNLYELEMALFADSESLAGKLLEKKNS
jgi:hypothetical protein